MQVCMWQATEILIRQVTCSRCCTQQVVACSRRRQPPPRRLRELREHTRDTAVHACLRKLKFEEHCNCPYLIDFNIRELGQRCAHLVLEPSGHGWFSSSSCREIPHAVEKSRAMVSPCAKPLHLALPAQLQQQSRSVRRFSVPRWRNTNAERL